KLGDVNLVRIDPVSSYMGAGIEGNTMTSVGPVLEAIADMAERTGVAVLLIHHPPKNATGGKAMNAFSGSLAFVAAPRISFIVVEEEQTDRYLMLPVKNTVGPKAAACGYYITETYVDGDAPPPIKTTLIEWDQAPVSMSANEALRGGSQLPRSKLERAQELLREQLAGGAVEVTDLVEVAKLAGIGKRTLRAAKVLIGVKSRKIGFQGGYEWYL